MGGLHLEKDVFEATTPYGPQKMVNLIARKRTGGSTVIAFTSHCDTKYFENIRFVGAILALCVYMHPPPPTYGHCGCR
jgi:hypothetical protein